MVTLSRSSLNSKKIGIWGLGISGQKLLKFLAGTSTQPIAILEKKEILASHTAILQEYPHECYVDTTQRPVFFKTCDIIIPSPGIALENTELETGKICTELDLFALYNQKTTIGITGSLGKTSITTLLAQLLDTNTHHTIAGGNIGNGIIETISTNADYLVLELSSFQLEYIQHFAPDIAVITNIYENHLDRHKTLENYMHAKLNIIRNQKTGQFAIMPASLAEKYQFQLPGNSTLVVWGESVGAVPSAVIHVYADSNGSIILKHQNTKKVLLTAAQVPTISFAQNWIIITAVLYCLNKLECLAQSNAMHIPEHRMEVLKMHGEIRYINDSKSTVMQATCAALDQCNKKSTILLLGGLSKGVDRTLYIPQLKGVFHIACFGHEADTLHGSCQTCNIPSSQHSTLEEALLQATKLAQAGMTILFSPGGSSYDLFSNYQSRGEHFKRLVSQR